MTGGGHSIENLCEHTEYPVEQEWEAFATVLLSPLVHNLPNLRLLQGHRSASLATWDCNLPGTRWWWCKYIDFSQKWIQKEWTQSTQHTMNLMQHIWDLRAVFGSTKDPDLLMKCLFYFGRLPLSQQIQSLWKSNVGQIQYVRAVPYRAPEPPVGDFSVNYS